MPPEVATDWDSGWAREPLDPAVVDEEARAPYPFCTLKGPANVLIFPNLDAGNAAYKLLAATGGAEIIGPIVLGMRKQVNVLQQGATVDAIVHMTAITVARAIRREAIERGSSPP